MPAIYHQIHRREIPLDQNQLRNIILHKWLVSRQQLYVKLLQLPDYTPV
jgi:hypothetical protein